MNDHIVTFTKPQWLACIIFNMTSCVPLSNGNKNGHNKTAEIIQPIYTNSIFFSTETTFNKAFINLHHILTRQESHKTWSNPQTRSVFCSTVHLNLLSWKRCSTVHCQWKTGSCFRKQSFELSGFGTTLLE